MSISGVSGSGQDHKDAYYRGFTEGVKSVQSQAGTTPPSTSSVSPTSTTSQPGSLSALENRRQTGSVTP